MKAFSYLYVLHSVSGLSKPKEGGLSLAFGSYAPFNSHHQTGLGQYRPWTLAPYLAPFGYPGFYLSEGVSPKPFSA